MVEDNPIDKLIQAVDQKDTETAIAAIREINYAICNPTEIY